MDQSNPDPMARLVAEIITAYLAQSKVEAASLPKLIAEVRAALEAGQSPAVGGSLLPEPVPEQRETKVVPPVGGLSAPKPAVPIADSVREDYIISLEDGRPYRSLRRHLMSKYGMTPDDYRRKWALGPDYPMVAPSYAKQRSDVAKRIGLGRSRKVKNKARAASGRNR